MSVSELADLVDLMRSRNLIDAKIGEIIGRPASPGHLGEWIASRVFDIELDSAANAKGSDGHFRTGPLAGRRVNVKWYAARDGKLDLKEVEGPDYYLVLTGPTTSARSSVGQLRPMRVDAVYLIHAGTIVADLAARGRRIGVASSVRNAAWTAAQVFPESNNPALPLNPEQRAALELFAQLGQ